MNVDSSGGVGDGCENVGHVGPWTPSSERASTPLAPIVEPESVRVEDPLGSVPIHPKMNIQTEDQQPGRAGEEQMTRNEEERLVQTEGQRSTQAEPSSSTSAGGGGSTS